VPVVVSSAASLAEVVGDAGEIVDPHHADTLAGAMLRLVAEPSRAADLARRGRERAAGFSWDAAAGRLAALFHSVLASRSPAGR
jgi:glycosyltransferase involved in cell wall biosynthesis